MTFNHLVIVTIMLNERVRTLFSVPLFAEMCVNRGLKSILMTCEP